MTTQQNLQIYFRGRNKLQRAFRGSMTTSNEYYPRVFTLKRIHIQSGICLQEVFGSQQKTILCRRLVPEPPPPPPPAGTLSGSMELWLSDACARSEFESRQRTNEFPVNSWGCSSRVPEFKISVNNSADPLCPRPNRIDDVNQLRIITVNFP